MLMAAADAEAVHHVVVSFDRFPLWISVPESC